MAENIDKRITGQLLSAKRATLVVMFVTPALLSLESMQPALAQTFDEASIEALRQICQGAAGEFPPTITVTSTRHHKSVIREARPLGWTVALRHWKGVAVGL